MGWDKHFYGHLFKPFLKKLGFSSKKQFAVPPVHDAESRQVLRTVMHVNVCSCCCTLLVTQLNMATFHARTAMHVSVHYCTLLVSQLTMVSSHKLCDMSVQVPVYMQYLLPNIV